MTTVEDAKRQQALAEEAKRLNLPEWQLEMARSVGTDLIQDIVADSRRSNSLKSIGAPSTGERGSGFAKEVPLRPPEGVAACDRLMDAADRRDRAKRERGEF